MKNIHLWFYSGKSLDYNSGVDHMKTLPFGGNTPHGGNPSLGGNPAHGPSMDLAKNQHQFLPGIHILQEEFVINFPLEKGIYPKNQWVSTFRTSLETAELAFVNDISLYVGPFG